MSLTPPKKPQYDIPPAGNHVARLYEINHLGTLLTNGQFGERMVDKIRLTFELSNERKEFKQGEGEKPYSISREFTYSFNAKGNLRPFIDGLTGTKMTDDEWPDLEALLGEACLLNVVHTTGEPVYANIQNASPLPKGMEAPALFNKPRSIDINSIPFDELDTLPEFIQKKMKSSEEYAARVNLSDKLEEAGLVQEPGKPVRPRILGGPASEPEAGDIPF
jgi:hypothetical protein